MVDSQDESPMKTGNPRFRDEIITLEPYEEVVGELETVRTDETHVYVELSVGTLAYSHESLAGKRCLQELANLVRSHESLVG